MEQPLLSVSIPLESLDKRLKQIIKASLNVEIYLNETMLESLDSNRIARIKKSLSHDPLISLHGPFISLSPGSKNPSIRQHTLKQWKKLLEVAEQLGAGQVVVHALSGVEEIALYDDIWLANSMSLWTEIVEVAERLDVLIAVENTYEYHYRSLQMLMDRLKSKHIGICLDIGHINLSRVTMPEEWFSNLGNKVIELHLHDNFGFDDNHMALGDGCINFAEIFGFAKKYTDNPLFTLECRSPDSVEKSIDLIHNHYSG